MSRSVSMQFHWFDTAEEAREYLQRAPLTSDSIGDRISASRRAEPPSASDVERIQLSQRWNAEYRARRGIASTSPSLT